MPRKPKSTPKIPKLGRPPEGTANGISRMRFDVPDHVADRIRGKHEEIARIAPIELGPFLARTVANALGLELPPPKKRGPKPQNEA